MFISVCISLIQVWAHVHMLKMCRQTGPRKRQVSNVPGTRGSGCPGLFNTLVEGESVGIKGKARKNKQKREFFLTIRIKRFDRNY